MKTFNIAVEWSMCGEVEVQAETLEDALKWARENEDELPVPTDGEYIDGSYLINESIELHEALNQE